MMGMVTGVGFLIHIFASWYMRGEEDYARFFLLFQPVRCQHVAARIGDNFGVIVLRLGRRRSMLYP